MQVVNDYWYKLYRWIAFGAAIIAALLGVASQLLPDSVPFVGTLDITVFTIILAVWQAIYALLIYDRIAAKANHWAAMISLAMVQAISIVGFVETTGRLESPFILWWVLAAVMSGSFGVMGAGGTAFVSLVYFIFASNTPAGKPEYTTLSYVGLATFLGLSVGSYLFWRRLFIDTDSEKVAMLSGQLKANQKQSELLVQSLTDGVLLLDNDGTIQLMNPAAAKMTGWAVADATGTDSKLVVTFNKEDGSELPPAEHPIVTLLSQNTGNTTVLQLVSREGTQIVVSVVTSPLINPKTQGPMGGMIVIRDISISHQSDKQRAEFISTASHEMRTPVAAIEGYLQLALNEKVSKIDPKAREYLTKALDSTHHLGSLFQDLLTSAKAEDGRLVSHPEVVELGEYIEQLSESFKFSAEKKGLLTDFIFGKSAGDQHVVRPLYYVFVDPDRLREVITNLFDNAVKYTPSGKISLGLTGNNEVVQVFVRDTGPGIAHDDISHLFQKFYRVDNSATRTIGGTGLGLFICKKIIELYNGRIWAESQVGQGSTFYINLPRLSSQQAQDLKSKAAQTGAPAPISSLTTPV